MNNLMIGMTVLAVILTSFACNSSLDNNDAEQLENRLPNIIYILADDLGYGDLRVYNPDTKNKTPQIDQLAKEGMIFTDAHSPSSVCTPTRYGILTGEYCWRSRLPQGVLRGYGKSLIQKGQMTVASFLKGQGYSTGVIGKWHLGLDWVLLDENALVLADQLQVNELGMISDMDGDLIDFSEKPTDGPLNHGFDYSFILPASLDMDPYVYLENDSLLEIPTDSTMGNDLNTGYTEAFWRAGKIAPDFQFDQVLPKFTQKAIEFIGEKQQEESPFFLYLPFAAPHTPWVPTDPFQGKSSAGTYGDFVQMVDDAVGQVLEELDRLGIKEETMVIFTSDNGPFWTPELIAQYDHKAAGNLRGMKADIWEAGHRVPFIVRWPGKVQANSQSNALTTLTNLLATTIDIVGVDFEVDPAPDSYSILPILLGKIETGQPHAVHHSSKGFFAIRKGDWKLIFGRGSGGFSKPSIVEVGAGQIPGQLYNLKTDIGEVKNLYGAYEEKVMELTIELAKIRSNY